MRYVVANIHGDRVARDGSLVHVIRVELGDPGRPLCSCISRGGRRVAKYVSVKNLSNIRTKGCYSGSDWLGDQDAEELKELLIKEKG